MKLCQYCQNGLYRWTIDVNTTTCVQECPAGMYEMYDTSAVMYACADCLTDCLECQDDTTCDYCILGKVSQWNGTHDECIDQCDQAYYEDDVGKCQQ